jgi:hypothetical protein
MYAELRRGRPSRKLISSIMRRRNGLSPMGFARQAQIAEACVSRTGSSSLGDRGDGLSLLLTDKSYGQSDRAQRTFAPGIRQLFLEMGLCMITVSEDRALRQIPSRLSLFTGRKKSI